MQILIPMAGKGSRFIRDGYTLPKPLIPISGNPMILNVIDDIPKGTKYIFLIQKKDLKKYRIDLVIKSKIKDAIIISVDGVTQGQASTCLLAKDYLEDDEELFIASADNGLLFDYKKFANLKNQNDCIIFTFTHDKKLISNPNSWGWCKINESNEILDISVKTPISDNPFKDHAITGNFYFKKCKEFIESAQKMIREDHRVNDEFYVDSVPLFMKEKKISIFDVDLYVGWGKPKDLYEYQEKEYYYKFAKDKLDSIWIKYFEDKNEN